MTSLLKSKLILIFAILMLVLNIVLIGTMFKKKGPKSPFEGPKNIVIERLDFNEKQVQAYDLLIADHREDVQELHHKILDAKTALFQNLGESSKDNVDSLILVLGDLQMEIELVHYNHFTDIQNLCEKDQLVKFELLKEDLADLFQHYKKPPKK